MKQGDIWQVYFDPVKGSEQAGNRPAVIISGNTLNINLNIVVVCPITTSVHNYEGNPVLVPIPRKWFVKNFRNNGLSHSFAIKKTALNGK